MKLYLGGKMVGVPGLGFEEFDIVAHALRALGHTIFNPAEHDRDCGYNPAPDDLGSYADVYPGGFNRRNALRADFDWIFSHSEGMVALENWTTSPGTRFEIAAHQSIFLPVWERNDFLHNGIDAPTLLPLIGSGKGKRDEHGNLAVYR